MRLVQILVPLVAATAVSCRSHQPLEPSGPEPVAWTLESVDAKPQPQPQQDGAAAARPVEASAPAPGQQQELSDDAARFERRQEQRGFLASEYLRQGDALLDRADLSGALLSYSSALEIDPSSQEARDKVRKVEGLLVGGTQEAADLLADATDREIVRRAEARIAAEDASLRGDEALRKGDYDAALDAYHQAETILRFHPLIASDSLDERIVSGKLQRAADLQREAEAARERDEREQARQQRASKEQAEVDYRENKLRTLYAEANAAFLSENYARSEMLLEQVLLEDPGNPAATELLENARNARHAKADETNRRNYREQWLRTFEEVNTMDVIQNETLVFDLKRWNEVSQRKPLEFKEGDQGHKEDQAVYDRLDQVRFKPNFGTADGEGAPLTEIATFLQNLTGVNFLVSRRVQEDLDEQDTAVRLQLPERSVRKVLDLIAETSEQVRWTVKNGVVMFVVKDELRGGQVLRTYEVRDLIHPIPDFPGREINVQPSGGVFQAEEQPEERDYNVVGDDALDQLIRDNIAPDSWNDDPANNLNITENGTMVVNQTPAVHEQIAQLLDDLREATGLMVDIQARFLNVENNFLEDIGVDFRGLGEPGPGTNEGFNDFGDPTTQTDLGKEIGSDTTLGAFYNRDNDLRARVENLYDLSLGNENGLTGAGGLTFQWVYLNDMQLELILRAVSKSERVELVTAPRITLYNTARGNVSVLNQVAYVADFDVEIAQAASIGDPIIGVVQDGVVLDVRPVVSADRRFITLELRPTVAQLQRPIREIVTTLGSQNSVTIQLPELDIQRVRTSIPMPDGGTVLLGGLKLSEKKDLRSGVPLLDKIPVVSFLFERKGNYVANRKLLVLLKAEIVIPQEQEPTPAQAPRTYTGL
jgi:Flp pilus assembly secretin CpaC